VDRSSTPPRCDRPAAVEALALVDHAGNRHLLTELFRVLPMFRLATATGPLAFDRLVAEHAPSLVIVDVRDPEAAVARVAHGPHAPAVVVLGTDPRPAAAARLLELGAAAHFLKPVDLAHLSGVLRSLARREVVDQTAPSECHREGSASHAHATAASWN
jgi:DNA-binding NarL/FixJ family response regulator